MYLSLEHTQVLSEILESKDWDQLEDLILTHGYDESQEPNTDYEWISVRYTHRRIYHP